MLRLHTSTSQWLHNSKLPAAAVLQHCVQTRRVTYARTKCKARTEGGVRWQTDQSDPVAHDLDAIVLLAGGQRRDGQLHSWVQRRVDVAVDLQRCQADSATPILCCGGGTPHKPPILKASGYVLHEGTELADHIISQGVDKRHLLKEASSYDTIGNGYFAATMHAVPAGWRKLAVVTSDFHMPRSRAIFETCFSLAGSTLFGDPDRFSLTFHAASDEGLFDEEVLAARRQREAASLVGWHKTASTLPDLAALHAWLHSQHLCYAVARQGEFGHQGGVDDKALDSY